MIFPIILSGGSGTRLWPLSRKLYPKQFINIISETTMFQDTVNRIPNELYSPIIVCNEEHRFIVAEQLRLAFPRMSVTEKDFRKSSTPGQMLFDSLSVNALDGSTYAHLRWDSLHPNWPLLISNAHEQWVIRHRRRLSVM